MSNYIFQIIGNQYIFVERTNKSMDIRMIEENQANELEELRVRYFL